MVVVFSFAVLLIVVGGTLLVMHPISKNYPRPLPSRTVKLKNGQRIIRTIYPKGSGF